jgi:hypothetical protein
MSGALTLHVNHVASTRMIAEGTDGLFHGNLTERVMKGASMLCFVPLQLSALERSPQLKTWVKDWFGSEESTWLTPLGWHDEGEKQNQCIWVHPPVVANVAVELLTKSKHKRPDDVHVVLIPRLLTSHWRNFLSKVCGGFFTVPVEVPYGKTHNMNR